MHRPVYYYITWITLLILAPAILAGAVEATSQPAASPVHIEMVTQPAPVFALPDAVPLASERRPYQLQPGSPAWLPNFIHPEAGCNWLGVAGQAFDAEGNPVTMLVVEVGGILSGNQIQSLSLTGVAPAYGPSGYEVHLGNRAVDSGSTLWIMLKDLSGKELSNRIYFDTFADCSRNLVLINFVESTFEIEVLEFFIPVFYNAGTGSTRRLSLDGEPGGENGLFVTHLPLFFNRYLPESTTP